MVGRGSGRAALLLAPRLIRLGRSLALPFSTPRLLSSVIFHFSCASRLTSVAQCKKLFKPGSPRIICREMEMHQIQYFLAVSEYLNFRRAAEECHVSAPALTRAIQKLGVMCTIGAHLSISWDFSPIFKRNIQGSS